MNKIYKVSENVVAREIEGEIVIVPIISGIGSMDDDLYTFNSTGKRLWQLIDGKKSCQEIISLLMEEYDESGGEISSQVLDLISELAGKGILVEA